MSSEVPQLPFSEGEYENDPFARLDIFKHDPVFQEILETVMQKQVAYNAIDVDGIWPDEAAMDADIERTGAYVDATLDDLNDLLDANEWIGTTVYLTGRLHLAPGMDISTAKHLNGVDWHRSDDGESAYCDVNNLPMIMGVVGMDDGLASEHQRYIFTFHTIDEIDKRAHDERLVERLLAEVGDYSVYPEELSLVRFESPSLQQIERTVQLYYPEVQKALNETFSGAIGPDGARILRALRRLTLPQFADYDEDTQVQIGRLVHSKLGVDKEAGYRCIVNGAVQSLAQNNDMVTATYNRGERIDGGIFTCDFDTQTGRPIIVITEDSSTGAGYEVRAVPVDAIERLHSRRSLRSKYGSVAMKVFVTPEDARVYWESGRDAPVDDTTALFEELSSLMQEAGNRYTFNEIERYYEVPVDEDLMRLHASFVDHLAAALNLRTQGVDVDAINEHLTKDIATMETLAIGDAVMTQHRAVVLTPRDGSTLSEVGILTEGQRLKGECVGFMVISCPSEVMVETMGREQSEAPGLVMLVKNAVVSAEHEEDSGAYDDIVAVVLASYIGTKFVKVQPVQEHEG